MHYLGSLKQRKTANLFRLLTSFTHGKGAFNPIPQTDNITYIAFRSMKARRSTVFSVNKPHTDLPLRNFMYIKIIAISLAVAQYILESNILMPPATTSLLWNM